MKATLEFELPKEQHEFNHTCNAQKYASALFEISHNLRKKINYKADAIRDNDDSVGESIYKGIDIVFDLIYIIIEDEGINIDDL